MYGVCDVYSLSGVWGGSPRGRLLPRPLPRPAPVGGAGSRRPRGWPYFFAVVSYAFQHPEGMCFTAGALAGLRASLGDALDGRATLEDLRRRARLGAAQAGRVTRRAGDGVVRSPVGPWPLAVVDVCAGGIAGSGERVELWARSVRESLYTAAPKQVL